MKRAERAGRRVAVSRGGKARGLGGKAAWMRFRSVSDIEYSLQIPEVRPIDYVGRYA